MEGDLDMQLLQVQAQIRRRSMTMPHEVSKDLIFNPFYWWILEQLHSITVLAHIGAFPNKYTLKVHKNENFFGFDFEFCPISLLVMHK
jgi:hypothetical protein